MRDEDKGEGTAVGAGDQCSEGVIGGAEGKAVGVAISCVFGSGMLSQVNVRVGGLLVAVVLCQLLANGFEDGTLGLRVVDVEGEHMLQLVDGLAGGKGSVAVVDVRDIEEVSEFGEDGDGWVLASTSVRGTVAGIGDEDAGVDVDEVFVAGCCGLEYVSGELMGNLSPC